MDDKDQNIPPSVEVERLARLVLDRLGVQPDLPVLREFLSEVASERHAAAYLDRLSLPDSTAEWAGEPAARLLTHETHFFRNEFHWEALRHDVIPELLRRPEAERTPLRIWSAGCASGEEPLSIAIALLDMGLHHLLGPNRIVATDVSDASLDAARAGRFGVRALQSMPADLANRFLEEQGDAWIIKQHVAELVRYQRLNLSDRLAVDDFIAGEGPFHIVFCRNVLIYFQTELCARLLGQFAAALHEDGVLFLGHAEFPQMWSDAFEPLHTCGTILWRHRGWARRANGKPATRRPHGLWLPEGATRAEPESGPRFREFTQAASPPRVSAAASEPAPDGPLAATRSATATADPETTSGEAWPGVIEVLQHAKCGRCGYAVSVARRLVEDHQLVPEAHYALGLALEVSSQPQCAIRAYRNAIFLDPEFAQAYWREGLTFAALRQRALAISAVRCAIKRIPAEHDARVQHLSDVSREELTRMMKRTLEWLLKQTN